MSIEFSNGFDNVVADDEIVVFYDGKKFASCQLDDYEDEADLFTDCEEFYSENIAVEEDADEWDSSKVKIVCLIPYLSGDYDLNMCSLFDTKDESGNYSYTPEMFKWHSLSDDEKWHVCYAVDNLHHTEVEDALSAGSYAFVGYFEDEEKFAKSVYEDEAEAIERVSEELYECIDWDDVYKTYLQHSYTKMGDCYYYDDSL
nr:MAG TPA: hypothetical protein [Caudoviricetes sp.]